MRVPRDSKAADRRSISPMSLTWTSKIDPMKTVCPQELRGQCSKVACEYQHLRRFESPKSRALRIVDSLEVFFSKAKWQEAEKAIVRTKLAIYGGKNVEESVSNLIASLCPKPGSIPLSTVAN